MLDVKNLTVRYGNLTILDSVSFSVSEGQWLMVVGPNGAGKSTLINAIAQAIPYTGTVSFEGRSVDTFKARERARLMGILTQAHAVNYPFTVREVIRLGRYAYAPGLFSRQHPDDEAAIARAIEQTSLAPLLNQSVLTLSGGELQRVFLAQLLTQNPRLLLLDEPTNHLDLKHQQQTFALIQDWLQSPGRAVISVVHDLSLAKAHGREALLLHQGQARAWGPVETVLSESHLSDVYAMDVYGWMRHALSHWQREK